MEARKQRLEALLQACSDPERRRWLEQLIAACTPEVRAAA